MSVQNLPLIFTVCLIIIDSANKNVNLEIDTGRNTMGKYLKGVKWLIVVQVIFALLDTIAIAMVPYLNKLLFDTNIQEGIGFLGLLLIGYIVAYLANGLFQYISHVYEWKTMKAFNVMLRNDLHRSIMKMKHEDYEKQSVGEYISMLDNDVDAITKDYMCPLVDILKFIVELIVYGVFMVVFVDYRVAIVIMLASLVSVFIPKLTAHRMGKLRMDYLEAKGKYTDKVKDLLDGKGHVNRQSYENITVMHAKRLEETERSLLRFGKFKTLTNVINGLVMYFITLAATMIVGYLMFKRELTIGAGVATLGYVDSFIYPVKYILGDINIINGTKGVRKNVLAVLNHQFHHQEDLPSYQESITVSDVSVTYEDFTLKPINYTFKKGGKYAVIGHSGSGKSTLLNVIAKEESGAEGSVLIDHHNILSYDTSTVLSYIHQDEHVFDDSIENNVTLFDSYTCVDCKLLATIGEDKEADELSGGEKQIMAYARAKSSNAEILLMDEPFSALDQDKYKMAIDDLLSLDQTVIHISHRFDTDTLASYDAVLTFEDGQLR